jgi:hypothetical protein
MKRMSRRAFSMMAASVPDRMTTAAGMTIGFCMAHGRRSWRRLVIEGLRMAHVVMFFVGVMIVKIGVILWSAPNRMAPRIRRVSANWIVWIAVVVSAPAVETSAQDAGAYGHYEERLN